MTLHQICEQARRAGCTCGAAPDQPCLCKPGCYHLARFAHARRAGLISMDDMGFVIRNYLAVVPDPEVTP